MIEKIFAIIAGWLVAVISTMGYPGIVLLMCIESSCIPLPSEVIMTFSGYLASTGRFNLHAVAFAGALGCAIGSAITYWIGARGGRSLVENYGRYFLIRRSDLDMADRFFQRWGLWASFISRMLPIVRTFISLPAGIGRVRFWPFLVLSFIGSVPWCYLLAYVGKVLGENWKGIHTYFHRADLAIVTLLLVAIGYWLWRHLKPEPAQKP